ncbi:lysozyme [Pseudomonas sp. SLFW]|uniref:lysozyme n=1 Tax=Pseudomonas sp. SLFW TaxID=2683259 RepID=UPI001411E9FD|nr:lysozyme [Pseudomonas sp. SLFW]NBB11834.1 glycoside hydrolase family protein [Pseudomonas sp. SLFW]
MRTSPKGFDLIKSAEGLRLTAYPDPATGGDPWTIGYGTTRGVKQGMRITVDQADQYLKADVARFEPELANLVKVPLTQNQWDALMSFVYNLGSANLASSTLLKLLNVGDYARAAEQFPRWNKAAGKEMPGLTKRRLAERSLFLSAA